MRSSVLVGLAVALTSVLPALAQPAPAAKPAAQPPPAPASSEPAWAEGPAPADASAARPAPNSTSTVPAGTPGAAPQPSGQPSSGPPDLMPFPGEPAALTPGPAVEPEDVGGLGSHQTHWQLNLGVRSSYITHSGFDAYSSNNSLVQFSLGAGRTVFAEGPLSVFAMLYWEVGGTSGTVRGVPTELGVHRWGLGPEVRWHFCRRVFVFGRPTFALHYLQTQLDDAVAQTALHARKASAGFDLSGGIAVELYGNRSGAAPTPRLWIMGEGGYGWSKAVSQRLKPDDDAPGPVRLEPVTLAPVGLTGGFFKVSAALSY